MRGAYVATFVFAVVIFGFAAFVIFANAVYAYQREKTGHFASAVVFLPTILAGIGTIAMRSLEDKGGVTWPWWPLGIVFVLDLFGHGFFSIVFRALGVGRIKPGERTLLAILDNGAEWHDLHAIRQHLTGIGLEGSDGKARAFPQVRGAFEAHVGERLACRVVFRAGTSPEQQAQIREMLRTKPGVARSQAWRRSARSRTKLSL